MERMEGERLRLTKRADMLRVKGRRGGRRRWEDCGRTTSRDGGVVTGGGDSSEIGTVTEGKKIDTQYRCQPHPDLGVKRKATT